MKTRKEARLYRSSWTQKLLSLFLVAVLTLSPGGLLARNLPTGGKIAKGQATINVNGQTMTIDQLTSKAIINWDSFDIGKGYGVDVNQISKNAAMLSRVIGGNPSEILGRLSATGHFYLVNPSGILFGQGAQVDVNRLIASTLDITDDNFMADKLLFEGSSDAAVINQGLINAQAVALIGKEVSNTGEINAKQVAMLGTKSVELGNVHGGKLSIDFSGFTEDSSVSNAGVINASELGEVILYAENGKTDNAQGTITTGELEISGKIVNLQELGNISFSHLLIDPTGVLYFGGDELSGGGVGEATGSPWPAADSYITEATIQTLLGTGALTLDWDQIIINGDVDVSGVTGGKRLTLKALGSGSNGGILTDGAHTLTMGGHDLYMVIEPTGTDGGDINLTDLTIITNSRLDIEARQKQILVNNEYNQLSGVVALKGRDVSLNNTGSTHFGVSTIRNGGSLQVTSGGKITQQGAITVQGSGTANFNAGTNDVILDHNGNAFSGTVSFIAKDVEIVNKHANGIQFAESEIGGNLTATATAGGISQTDAISVGGASLLSAAEGFDILLDNADNALAGTIDFTGKDVTINNTVETILAGTAGGDLNVSSAKEISQSGALDITGTSTFTAHNGSDPQDIALTNEDNAFAGNIIIVNAQDVEITNSLDTTFGDSQVFGDLTVTANDGAAAKNIDLSDNANAIHGSIHFDGANVSINNTVGTILAGTASGNLIVTSEGAIGQSDALDITGTASFIADDGTDKLDITLENSGNKFDGAINFTGADVSITNTLATVLDPSSATGALAVTSGGAITQNGILTVGETTTLNAVDSDITLDKDNVLVGAIDFGGKDVSINNTVGTILAGTASGNLTVTSKGAISQSDALDITGTSSFTADNGTDKQDITLNDTGNKFNGAIDFDGAAVKISNTEPTKFDASSADGNLEVISGGPIIQIGALDITGTSSFTADDGTDKFDITLENTGNKFTGAIDFDGGNVSIYNTLDTLLAGGSATGNLTIKSEEGINSDENNITAGGDIEIIAELGDIELNSENLTAGAKIEITAEDGNLTLGDGNTEGTVTAGGHISLEAKTGSSGNAHFIVVNSAVETTDETDGAISLNATGAITVNNSLDAASYIVVQAKKNIDINDNLTAKGQEDLDGYGIYIESSDAGYIKSADGTKIIAELGDIVITTTDGNIELDSTLIDSAAEISIKAIAGDVKVGTASGTDEVKASTNILISASGDVTSNADLLAGNDVVIASTGANVVINADISATVGKIDMDAKEGIEVSGAILATGDKDNEILGGNIELYAEKSDVTLSNAELDASANAWAHTSEGDISLTNSSITAGEGVDLYAAADASTVTMDAGSSITAGAQVTVSADGGVTVENISATDFLLVDVTNRNDVAGAGVLSIVGAISSSDGNIYLSADDMAIEATVSTGEGGDIYVYANNNRETYLGDEDDGDGTGLSLNATEIGNLQAADTQALIIGMGNKYDPAMDIKNDMGALDTSSKTTTQNINQIGAADSGSKNVGIITDAAITRQDLDSYLTIADGGSLALLADQGIDFGLTGSIELAAFNASAGDIVLHLGGTENDYTVASLGNGTNPTAAALGKGIIGIINEAAGEDILVLAAADVSGNTLNINADIYGTADDGLVGTRNDIVFDLAGNNIVQDADADILAADGDVVILVDEMLLSYINARNVAILHSGDVIDNNDGNGVALNIDALSLYTQAEGVFGLGDAIETSLQNLQIVTDEDVNIVNYGDITIGGASFELDGMVAGGYNDPSLITPGAGITQSGGDTYIDVGVNRIFVEGAIEQQNGGEAYGGNVTLVAADIILNAAIITGTDAEGEGGLISLIPTYQHTNITITGYDVDGNTLKDSELGRQWVFDMNNLPHLQTDGGINIGAPGHHGELRFDGLGAEVNLVNLVNPVAAWTFYGGNTLFADNTSFGSAAVNLFATGSITGDGIVSANSLYAESKGGFELETALAQIAVRNQDGDVIISNTGDLLLDNSLLAQIAVRNQDGDVIINNNGTLLLDNSFTSNGDFIASTQSPLTVIGNVSTIGTGDITLSSSGGDDLTVISGVTINSAGSLNLIAPSAGNIVLGDGPGDVELLAALNINLDADAILIDQADLALSAGSLITRAENISGDGALDTSLVNLTNFTGAKVFVDLDNITLGQTIADGDLELLGDIELLGKLEVAGGRLILDSAGNLVNADIFADSAYIKANTIANSSIVAASGDLVFDAKDLYNLNVSAGANIDGQNVDGNIVGGSYVATDSITFDNAAYIASLGLDAGDDITLVATGKVELVEAKANDALSISAAAIDGSTLISNHGDVTLNSQSDISNNTVLAANAATIELVGDLNNNIVTADSITITGLENLENGSYLARASDLSVEASGDIVGATLTAEAGNVTLEADGSIASATVTALTNVELKADTIANSRITAEQGSVGFEAGDLYNLDVIARGDIKDSASGVQGNIVMGSYLAGNDIVFEKAATIASAGFDASNDISLTASGNIEMVDVKANDNATLNAGAELNTVTVLANNGKVELSADLINNVTAQAATTASLTATDIVDAMVAASSNISVAAESIDGGQLRADLVEFEGNGGEISIGSEAAVNVVGAESITVTDGALVNIASNNDNDTSFEVIRASGDVILSQGLGNMLVNIETGANVVLAADADITGDVTADKLSISTAENVVLDTDINTLKANVAETLKLVEANDLAIDLVQAGKSVSLQALAGNISDSENDQIVDIIAPEIILSVTGDIGPNGNALELSGQSLAIDADGLVNLFNLSSQDVTVTALRAGESISYLANGAATTSFDTDVTAGNFIDIASAQGVLSFEQGYSVITTGDIRIEATQNDVFLNGDEVSGDSITVIAGGALVSNSELNAENDIGLFAYDEVELWGDINSANGDVNVEALTGELLVEGLIIAENGDIYLESGDDDILLYAGLTAENVSITALKGDVLSNDYGTIYASEGIEVYTEAGQVELLGQLYADDYVSIDAVGSVYAADIYSGDVSVLTSGSNAGIDINLTADSADLVAVASGIDSDIWLSANNVNLNEVSAFDGNVSIEAAGNVYAADVQALDEGEVNGLVDDAHSVSISASGTLQISSIVADYDANIVAGGDVTGSGGLDIQAGNDIDLTLGGSAGTLGGAPLTVEAGGKVKVGKTDSTPSYGKGVWVLMQGTSGDGEIHYSTPGNNPPGTIIWNGKYWGGSETARLSLDRAEDGVMGEVRSILDRYQATSLWYSGFQYFPHVRAYLDGYQGNLSIEHILTGRGTVEGLPEGFGPTTVIDYQEIDESLLWQDKQASVK